jgi:hypothetical protein
LGLEDNTEASFSKFALNFEVFEACFPFGLGFDGDVLLDFFVDRDVWIFLWSIIWVFDFLFGFDEWLSDWTNIWCGFGRLLCCATD